MCCHSMRYCSVKEGERGVDKGKRKKEEDKEVEGEAGELSELSLSVAIVSKSIIIISA